MKRFGSTFRRITVSVCPCGRPEGRHGRARAMRVLVIRASPVVRGWPGRRKQTPGHDDVARVQVDGGRYNMSFLRGVRAIGAGGRTPVLNRSFLK